MDILGIIVPVFGVVLLGYLAAKFGFFTGSDIRGLTKFVFAFAVPAMLFDTLATTALPAQIEWGYLASYYLGAFSVYGLGMLLGKRAFAQSLAEQAVFGLGAAYSNMVLLGIPLVLLAFGDAASVPLFLLIAFHSGLMFFTVSAIAEVGRGRGHHAFGKLVWITLRGLAKNPIVGGLLLGLAFNLLGLEIPDLLKRIIETLGRAALPCAVFALGASLSGYRIAGQLPRALTLVGLKLLLHPLLVWLLAGFVFGVAPLWTAVAVTMAALPVGVNVYLFAQRYASCVAPVATAILLSTGLSVGTLFLLLLWWLNAG